MSASLKLESIMLMRSAKDFKKVVKESSLRSFDFQKLFVIVYTNGSYKDAVEVFEYFWKKNVSKIKVLFERSKEFVVLSTFNPYSSTSCRQSEPKEINRFISGSFEKNLRKSLFFTFGTMTVSGSDIKILKTIAKQLKFKIEYSFINGSDATWGNVFNNGTEL